MSSKIEIPRVCQFCDSVFIAKTTKTQYCSHKCASRAYKKKNKQNKIDDSNNETLSKLSSIQVPTLNSNEYLTPRKVAEMLGVNRSTIYRYLADNIFKCIVIRGKTFIRKKDIDDMFDNALPYKKTRIKLKHDPITEVYTLKEIKEKFKLKESWIYKIIREKNIPKQFIRGKNYYSKKHIDEAFSSYSSKSEYTEWYSVEDIQNKYKITVNAIYSFVYEHAIPKKKEGRQVLYSKLHFDEAKGDNSSGDQLYYTVDEAIQKYNITRDALYYYVNEHNIPKIKEGRSIKISKIPLDKILEKPIIQ